MHFVEWKVLYFVSTFSEIGCWGPIDIKVNIGPADGLAPNWWQSITSANEN